MALRPVASTTARVPCTRGARSRGYKLLGEGTDPRSLLGRCAYCLSKVCVPRFYVSCLKESVSISRRESPLDVAPAFPFIVSKGRARVIFMVKR
jgi:hypothetical protein